MDSGKVVGLLSRQRHDYANHMQVIKGYLELKMPERAMEYVDSVVRELARESHLFHSAPPDVSIRLYELQLWTRDRGIFLRFGDLEFVKSAGVIFSKELNSIYQIFEDLKVPTGENELEVRLDLVENKEQLNV
ncbi:MAG: Spo0B domain-containing protein, partial [Bacillota bacterium]